MVISASDFDFICRLVYARSAIVIEPGKEYLAESRLQPLARESGCESLRALIQRLQTDPHHPLHQRVVEAMTTNETSFFRDKHPFDALRETLLPKLIEKRRAERRLHLWSAACSSGQEPYSLVMLLQEHFPVLNGWDVRILATDISQGMLGRAREGRYGPFEMQRGLPESFRDRHFIRADTDWQIKEPLRQRVEFKPLNLAQPFPALPLMDVIFLRNVLIYFDVEAKKSILARMRKVLRPDGYLFLGGAETTLNLDDSYERLQVGKTSCFQLRGR